MLKEKYSKGIIGSNYISLIYALISLKKRKSSLIINQKDIHFANLWHKNIGQIEVNLLKFFAREFEISSLGNIEKYITVQNTILHLDERTLELSDSALINIKEIARKFPDSLSKVYLDKLADIDEAEFNKDIESILSKLGREATDSYKRKKVDELFKFSKDSILGEVFDSFLRYLKTESFDSKQFHFVLQILFQTSFSSSLDDLETKFLLLSLICPRYRVDIKMLEADLLAEYREFGGETKSTFIKDWGIIDSELHYILLNSIDGIVKIDSLNLFGQISPKIPFQTDLSAKKYLSINLSAKVDHDFIHFLKNKRIIFSQKERMGSDFPIWEVFIDDDGLLKAVYVYAEYLGTKPSFYYHHAIEDLYNSLVTILPGLNRADWVSGVSLSAGQDLWIEYAPKSSKELFQKSKLKQIYSLENKKEIKFFEHCGPSRAKSLGLYSYLLDVFA